MDRGLTVLALLVGLAACGVDGGDGSGARAAPRSKRIAQISAVDGVPPIESIYTPIYDGDHIVAVHRTDPFVDKDTMTFRYDGDQLVTIADGKNTIRLGWSDGFPVQLNMNGAPFDYTYEDDLLATASYGGNELGRYVYEDRHLVTIDVRNGTDVELSYDDQEHVTGITGRPNAEYTYLAGALTYIVAGDVYEITYENDLIKTVARSGVRSPLTITYTYDDGELVGFNPVPPIPQAALFGLDGKPHATVDLLSIQLTGNAFSAF